MAAPIPEVFERVGPWTDAEFLVLTGPIAVTLDLAAMAAIIRPPS